MARETTTELSKVRLHVGTGIPVNATDVIKGDLYLQTDDSGAAIWQASADGGTWKLANVPDKTVTNYTTAGVYAITAAAVLGGVITRDPNGAARADTVPTPAALVAAISNPYVGKTIEFAIVNTADAAETITVTAVTDATLVGSMAIAQNESARFMARLTNVTSGSEAYTLYRV